MVLVAMRQKVAVARLVLLPVLEVVDSDVGVRYMTHLSLGFSFFY